MNAFTKKTLVTALAAAGSLGMVGAANAVNVNPDGLGNVLIYPYYTVKADPNGNRWTTLLSIGNTTNSVKSVKIRFREALNSQEVLDFNIFLSAYDMWTGALSATSSGGAQIATLDRSCTIPTLTAGTLYPFLTGALGDGGGTAVTRTAEGYVEVFEMGTYPGATTTAKGATHDQSKNPPVPTCSGVTDQNAQNDIVQAPGATGTGGLFGTVILVNPGSGGAFTQNATALDNFPAPGVYSTTGSVLPDYTQAVPTSNQISGSTAATARFFRTDWFPVGQNAVTAVLMADSIINEYVQDASGVTKDATNWIITHPTKYLYVNSANPIPPFTSVWTSKAPVACETVSAISVWNREESTSLVQQFSPAGNLELCYEANVLGFNSTNIFGSSTFQSVAAPFNFGWALLNFPNQKMIPAPANVIAVNLANGAVVQGPGPAVTYYGLPVVGFSAATAASGATIQVGTQTVSAAFGTENRHRQLPAVR